MNEKPNINKESSYLFWAFTITVGWFMLIIGMAYYNYSLNSPKTVNLNELGDFFAGATSPLAIFWLVMVYLQQRKEMRAQVAQTEKIAHETQKQVEVMDLQFKKQYEPFFVCHDVKADMFTKVNQERGFRASITVENIRGIATHLSGELLGVNNQSSKFDISVDKEKQHSLVDTNAAFFE